VIIPTVSPLGQGKYSQGAGIETRAAHQCDVLVRVSLDKGPSTPA
jgi:hypothetical protein